MAEEIDSLIPDPDEEDAEIIEELEEEIEEEDQESAGGPQYKEGLKFENDLMLDGTGNIIITEPEDAWLDWCKKTLATPRYLCDEYSDQVGIDVEAAFEANSRAEAEEILRTEISEALEADPYGRTVMVEQIDFQWIAPDAVEVSVLITGFDSIRETITTTIENIDMGG